MDNLKIYFIVSPLFLVSFLAANTKLAAQDNPNPYAQTGNMGLYEEKVTLQINPETINVLSAGSAILSGNLKKSVRNFMFLWVEPTAIGEYSLEWDVKVSKTDIYEVTSGILAPEGTFELISNGKKHRGLLKSQDWSRIVLGSIKLKKGVNKIRLQVRSDNNFRIGALELTRPKIAQSILAEARSVRQDPDWFKDAGYGLMFQWTNRATPLKGNGIMAWEDKVNAFDVESFANMVDKTGAAYVIWSITWGEQYISAPIIALDRLIEGRTTKRDLLGEIADELSERGIKLIFYYHYGYDCYHSKDPEWMKAVGGYESDKSKLYGNIENIIAEIGSKYGKKLNGWFFDGGHRYYDAHFDGTKGRILTAQFKNLSMAARTGNDQRILTYNSWIKPRLTEYQDFYAGENLQEFSDLNDGIFTMGKHEGLMAHTCFTLEKRWGHIDLDTPIENPKYTAKEIINRVLHGQKNRYPLSINLEMYEDGSVSSASIQLIEKVNDAINGH